MGECGLIRSDPDFGLARGLQGSGRLVCVFQVVLDTGRYGQRTNVFASIADPGHVRRRRQSNDERADGLPWGNIRLEDTPASARSILGAPGLFHELLEGMGQASA